MSSVYDDLMAHQRTTAALEAVAARTGWDQETMMPPGAAAQRGEELAALEAVLHARRSDPRIGDWLAALPDEMDPVRDAQRRKVARDYDRATRIPADLATTIARVTSLAQGEWAAARAERRFEDFRTRLAEVVALKRAEAAALSDGDPYDALLDGFEPGMTAARLEGMFAALRPRLMALRDRVLGAPQPPALSAHFDEAAQLRLSREVAAAFGYDFERGRIDRAVHPFSSGSGADVRITTRTDSADPFNCIYATIHEVGHAAYEQNVDPGLALTPIGAGVSMAVHESQSRLFENQFGRSQSFTSWLYGHMRDAFGAFGVADARSFYNVVNRVTPGLIRTEADEVSYNLHVLVRFDLERALIAGTLDVADLEAAWNARFQEDLHLDVPDAAQGVLQDVHWAVGLFGYFPTYTLGNVYAGCLYAALSRDVPAIESELAAGRTDAPRAWLRDRVHRHGGRVPPEDLIAQATGEAPSESPLLDYLEAKYAALICG